jgi:hypothetical protein
MINLPRKLKKIEDEEWREMPGTNGQYQISNYGRVKSFFYSKEGKILKQGLINNFPAISLKINKKNIRFFVHKLVAENWLPKPDFDPDHVIHLDWNTKNNHYGNLEWASKEMVKTRKAAYLKIKYNDPNRPKVITQNKLNEKDVQVIKSMLLKGVANTTIAKMFCISDMQVTRIKRGENWGHVKVEELKIV